jgi:outer membrane protein assembly factor BamE (lipoprotein component of BamABCDE complex)
MKKFTSYLLAGVLAVGACSPNVETRGHLKDPDWREHVVPNQSTQDDVLQALGTPSTKATFGDETWYYVTTRRESVAFLKPEVVDDEVVTITFGPNGLVNNVTTRGRETARDIEIAEKITPTEGHQLTFMEQLLGNLGRFNAPGSAPGSSTTSGARRSPGTTR